jgi:hypothetical protein
MEKVKKKLKQNPPQISNKKKQEKYQKIPHKKYYNKDGIEIPSVTTILGIVTPRNLVKWANNIGKKGIDSNIYIQKSADVGTMTHGYIENFFLKKLDENNFDNFFEENKNIYDIDDCYLAYNAFLNFLNWKDIHKIKPILLEKELVSEKYQYGGTIDLYGKIDGKLILCDFKTSNYFDKKMYAQLSAYKYLLEENGYDVEGLQILKLEKTININIPFLEKKFENKDMNIYWKYFKVCHKLFLLNNEIEENENP